MTRDAAGSGIGEALAVGRAVHAKGNTFLLCIAGRCVHVEPACLPLPGHVSRAHHGMLFLDELPEFRPRILEVLRQPLENDCIRKQ
jgi:Magnesium chelatase, subunit ChlI